MRAFLALLAVFAAIWLVGAVAQGLLLATSVTSRRICLFTWWFEKFAFGMVVGFALGAVVTWFALRRRSGSDPRPHRRPERDHAERTEEGLAALRAELSAFDPDR
jgi:ABC-type nickel/cobalt efflux system permease component RcnA